jgi:hypothetical protein
MLARARRYREKNKARHDLKNKRWAAANPDRARASKGAWHSRLVTSGLALDLIEMRLMLLELRRDLRR